MGNDGQIEFQPVYLVVGTDARKREVVVERLRKRLGEYGDLGFNMESFDAQDADAGDIISSCNTIPFAAQYRLVEVRQPHLLRKADSDELAAYLKSPNPQCVLCLVGEKLAKNGRLYKAAAAFPKAVIACDLPKAADMPRLVKSMAVGRGLVLTDSAARLLAGYMGTDTVGIDSELAKLSVNRQTNDPVSESEIRSLVHDKGIASTWEFLDAYSDRDISRALTLLRKLSGESPYYLLAALQGRIRDLLVCCTLPSQGQPALAEALQKQAWQVRNYPKWARKHGAASLGKALAASLETEFQMKTGTHAQEALEDFVVRSLA